MGKVVVCIVIGVVLMGCQGFPGFENANAEPKPILMASSAPSNGKATVKPQAPSPSASDGIVSVLTATPVLQTDAAAVSAGIVVPPLVEGDPRASALAAEKAQVDQLVSQGALTREAGAKRLYRFAVKEGIAKGKVDEAFWQLLIQAYRNLDDRFISAEDAAVDINAAATRRAASMR